MTVSLAGFNPCYFVLPLTCLVSSQKKDVEGKIDRSRLLHFIAAPCFNSRMIPTRIPSCPTFYHITWRGGCHFRFRWRRFYPAGVLSSEGSILSWDAAHFTTRGTVEGGRVCRKNHNISQRVSEASILSLSSRLWYFPLKTLLYPFFIGTLIGGFFPHYFFPWVASYTVKISA